MTRLTRMTRLSDGDMDGFLELSEKTRFTKMSTKSRTTQFFNEQGKR